jgi:hypothetical protein
VAGWQGGSGRHIKKKERRKNCCMVFKVFWAGKFLCVFTEFKKKTKNFYQSNF